MPTITETSYIACIGNILIKPSSKWGVGVITDDKGKSVRYRGIELMVTVWKDTPESEFQMEYRYRYIVDASVFTSKDVKHFFNAAFKDRMTEEELVDAAEKLLSAAETAAGGPQYCKKEMLHIRGGVDELVEASKHSTFVNFGGKFKKEEVEADIEGVKQRAEETRLNVKNRRN